MNYILLTTQMEGAQWDPLYNSMFYRLNQKILICKLKKIFGLGGVFFSKIIPIKEKFFNNGVG